MEKPDKIRHKSDSGFSPSAIEARYTDNRHLTNYEQRYTGLSDTENICFNFKIDAFVPALNLAVEFKAHPLNGKKSIRTSLNKLLSQAKYRNLVSPTYNPEVSQQSHDKLSRMLWVKGHKTDCLNHAWNHALAKHQLVSQHFSGQYLVVFANNVSLDTDKLKRKGITAVHERVFNKALDLLPDTQAARKLLGLPNIH